MTYTTFSELLFHKHLDWQREQGEDKTDAEFAAYLGVPPTTFATWRKGKSAPTDEAILRKLADRLGMEVYDVLGVPRPDFRLNKIIQEWPTLEDDVKKSVWDQFEQGAKERDGQKLKVGVGKRKTS